MDGRSKLAFVWCPVGIVEKKVFMENDRTAYKIQVFYDPKWSTKYKSLWWRFIEMDTTVVFKCVSFFFLRSWLDGPHVPWFAAIIKNAFFYWK